MDNETLLAIVSVVLFFLYCLYFTTYVVYIGHNREGNWDTFHACHNKTPYALTAAALIVIPGLIVAGIVLFFNP